MRIFDYYKANKGEKFVIGLGYFDSVHKGHAYLISKVVDMAKRLGATPAIFTFNNNPFALFGRPDTNIFPLSERMRRLASLGIKALITVDADTKFLGTDSENFLRIMVDDYDVVGFVSGTDYTFGDKARGNADYLREFALRHGIECEIVDLVKESGRKIASRDIRKMLEDGDLVRVNELLSEPYSVTGTVRSGRGAGKSIGIPTANIDIIDGTLIIKNGVYSTIVEVDGKRYRAVTNVGGHPTFGDNSKNIEPHILDFSGDIYGKEIKVIFYRWLRGVKKFDSVKELQDTIARDEITTREEIVL